MLRTRACRPLQGPDHARRVGAMLHLLVRSAGADPLSAATWGQAREALHEARDAIASSDRFSLATTFWHSRHSMAKGLAIDLTVSQLTLRRPPPVRQRRRPLPRRTPPTPAPPTSPPPGPPPVSTCSPCFCSSACWVLQQPSNSWPAPAPTCYAALLLRIVWGQERWSLDAVLGLERPKCSSNPSIPPVAPHRPVQFARPARVFEIGRKRERR